MIKYFDIIFIYWAFTTGLINMISGIGPDKYYPVIALIDLTIHLWGLYFFIRFICYLSDCNEFYVKFSPYFQENRIKFFRCGLFEIPPRKVLPK